ncbi:YkvA family protein [Mesorhizobium sp. Mes31]|uniref:YkvA family protein n=1 Tax=Mesorhizobium sp. Mes31 TaxID=2926017 RepID=UPI0035C70506
MAETLKCHGRKGTLFGRRRLRAQSDRSDPEFIPIIGYLDDLVIVPLTLGIASALRTIPPERLGDLRRTTKERTSARPQSSHHRALHCCHIDSRWCWPISQPDLTKQYRPGDSPERSNVY